MTDATPPAGESVLLFLAGFFVATPSAGCRQGWDLENERKIDADLGSMRGMIRPARMEDVPVIAEFVRELAEYERLSDEVVLREEDLRQHLFGKRRYAEVLIAEDENGVAVGFALFMHNYSTFLASPGIYLEDLFVRPAHRGKGHGKALLGELARIAVERGCGRFEWAVLDWNSPAIEFYRSLGARPMHEWTIFRVTGDALLKLGGGSQKPRQ